MEEKEIICLMADTLSMDMIELDLGNSDDLSFSAESDSDKNNSNIEDDGFGTEESITPESVDVSDTTNQEVPPSSQPEDKSNGKSPSQNVYLETLKSLKEDGLFPDIEEDFVTTVTTPEQFREAFNRQIEARLTAEQRRVKEALDLGVPTDEVAQLEQSMQFFESLTDDAIAAETPEAENVRKELIYQDLISKGFKEDRAKKAVEKSILDATDIEDAKEALLALKEKVETQYNTILESKRVEERKVKEEQVKFTSNLQKMALETEAPFDGLNLDNTTRKKIWENISKPVHKASDGAQLTELQKFALEKPAEASYYLSLFYTLTNGFTKLDAITKKTSIAIQKKGVERLEKLLAVPDPIGTSSLDSQVNSEISEFSGELDV